MSRAPQAPLDDSYKSILIPDISGGMITIAGPLALSSNQSPAMLNIIPLKGRALFRGGFKNIVVLPAAADGIWPFYDSAGARHIAIWSNGNLYDAVSGSLVLVVAGVYAAGSRVGHVDFNGVLYWSVGQPVITPLQFWNPVGNTKGSVISSGSPGSVNPPASSFLFLYVNSIVACAPTFTGPVYQPNTFCWCNTGDPTTWLGTSSQVVGPNNGGMVNYGRPFGIAEIGVAPFRNIVVGRNDFGIYAYSGALTQLTEALLNCPVGIKDPDSAQYLPTDTLFGAILFLGTDGQIWGTNGITAAPVSDNILPSLTQAFNNSLAINSNQRFFSGYNQRWQYYYIDLNGTQFAYRWATNAWTMFQGWPSGPSCAFTDSTGAPAYYVAGANLPVNNFAQIGIDGLPDNGVMPVTYYSTPLLHGGNIQKFKDFHYCCISTYDSGAIYSVQAQSIKRADGSLMITTPNQFVAPNVSSGSPFIVGSSLLAGTNVLAGVSPPGQPGTPVAMQARLSVPIPVGPFSPAGRFESLKGNAALFTISWAGGNTVFDLLSAEVLYVDKGFRRGAGGPLSSEDIPGAPFDPFDPNHG